MPSKRQSFCFYLTFSRTRHGAAGCPPQHHRRCLFSRVPASQSPLQPPRLARHDAIRLPSPGLGPRLNLVPPRSIPLTTSFLVSFTPCCAYSPCSLACFLPTPFCYILGISLHLYPRSCIKLLGMLTLPVLASLAFFILGSKGHCCFILAHSNKFTYLTQTFHRPWKRPSCLPCDSAAVSSCPVLLLNSSFPDSPSKLMLKLSCAAPLPLCSQLCFPYHHLPS